MCHLYGAPYVTGGCDEASRAFFELGKSLESLPQPLTCLSYTRVESQLPSQSMASGRHMPHVTRKSSSLRRMGGSRWCPKDCVDQEIIGARELSGYANATIANASPACKCVQSGQICLPACGCAANGCLSIFGVADS